MPQTPPKNYYQLLELENFADLDQVKSAYRRLARQYHPDLNDGNKLHEERFKLINEAYEMVGSADKKAIYDDALRARLKVASKVPPPQKKDTASSASAPPKSTTHQHSKEHSEKAPVNEFFESVRKAFSHESPPGSSPYHQSKASKQKAANAKRGQDVTVEALITAAEAKEGVVKTVNVQHQDMCKRCSGSGKLLAKQCPMCHGDKVITRLKKIDVRIPAGVKSGSKVRVAAEGVRGDFGGESGDLFLHIQVSPELHSKQEEQLRVEGMDVYGELSIAMTDAVLGATVDVQTLHGLFKLTIPPLTSSGKMLRLKEQGVQASGSKGDHYVTIRIVAPENLSARERELYQELAQLHHQKQKH